MGLTGLEIHAVGFVIDAEVVETDAEGVLWIFDSDLDLLIGVVSLYCLLFDVSDLDGCVVSCWSSFFSSLVYKTWHILYVFDYVCVKETMHEILSGIYVI